MAQGIKENACGMISDLEDEGYLTDIPDENHIPDNGGFRTSKKAHTWSTAYHILHDFVSIEDLRKTPKDMDGTVWYEEWWDVFYCAGEYPTDPSQVSSFAYLDYLVKKNASAKAENHINGRFSGYIYTQFGRIADVSYALEGYTVGNPFRLPNVSLPGVSKHTSGLAVDVSVGILREDIWKQTGYTEIDNIAHDNRLKRPLNNSNYVAYTDDEIAEFWHFEPFGK